MATIDPSDENPDDPERWPTTDDEELLPYPFDRLVPTEQLVHGEHNPRKEKPSDGLQNSIVTHGIEHALIVHQPESGVYHITDGWQRFQAALNAGWEQFPVELHETATAAIRKTERESLGKDYSVYHWAKLCRSYAAEVSDGSIRDVARQVAKQLDNARSARTITRYLRVLSLPGEIHPLLTDGPAGTEQDWEALRTHNPDVKRCNGLSWVVAEEIAKHADVIDGQRAIGIAANAVILDDHMTAKEYVRQAVNSSERLPETVLRQVQFNGQRDRRIKLPRAVLSVSPDEKQALMRHLHQTRTTLPQFVESQVTELIEEVIAAESD